MKKLFILTLAAGSILSLNAQLLDSKNSTTELTASSRLISESNDSDTKTAQTSPEKTSESSAEEESNKFGMTVAINSDAFFGFAPAAFGSYSLGENVDLTFYGIFWSGGTASAWGNWTEFGAGVNFNVADGALSINPAIGVLGGSLLSGLGKTKFPDGIVPNITTGLDTDLFEGEFYFGYYMGLSEGDDLVVPSEKVATTLNYVHYWASLGMKTGSPFSAGLLWEHLFLAGGSNIDETTQYFQSFGPYIQFADPKGISSLRFSMGANLADEETRAFDSNAYYKLTLALSF